MKINFFLYKNEKLIIKDLNNKALYDKTNARLKFVHENVAMIVDFKGNFFERKTKEFTFKLDVINKTAFIEFADYNKINLNVSHLNYSFKKQKISIEYTIETEPEIINKILIELESELFYE